jgi:hypothetical protein
MPQPLPPPEQTEVFFCSNAATDSITNENVRVIASKLQARGIRVIEDWDQWGRTSAERLERIAHIRVALFLLAGPLSAEQKLIYARLEQAGCRIIPVILPNAKKTFALPELLRHWKKYIDFRGRFLDLDMEKLAQGVLDAWQAGPVKHRDTETHVFLSYFHDDHELVAPLRQELERADHAVWWDRGKGLLPPGTMGWESKIKQAIRRSYAFILCMSEISMMRSRAWVYPEIIEAIEVQRSLNPSKIFIIPVRLSECEVPDMPIDAVRTLKTLQHFDYYGSNKSISELVAVLDVARQQGATSAHR